MEYNSIITEFWEEHGTPEAERFVNLSMDIIDEIHQALAGKGWTQKELANAVGKSPAEISKWLSGLHNMTLKSLVKLEIALDKHLIITESVATEKYHNDIKMVSFGTIMTNEIKDANYNSIVVNNPLKVVYKKAS